MRAIGSPALIDKVHAAIERAERDLTSG